MAPGVFRKLLDKTILYGPKVPGFTPEALRERMKKESEWALSRLKLRERRV
jgi:hypothetical protein